MPWRASGGPWLAPLCGGDQGDGRVPIAVEPRHGVSRLEERAGGAGRQALAARRAGRRLAPGPVQVGDHAGVRAPAREAPGVRPLDLAADPDASGAEDTTVVVD